MKDGATGERKVPAEQEPDKLLQVLCSVIADFEKHHEIKIPERKELANGVRKTCLSMIERALVVYHLGILKIAEGIVNPADDPRMKKAFKTDEEKRLVQAAVNTFRARIIYAMNKVEDPTAGEAEDDDSRSGGEKESP
jgi:hypothetical protein